jgi:hypothetical protein
MDYARQDKSGKGQDRHQAIGHEFPRFGQTNREKHQQENQHESRKDLGEMRLKDGIRVAEDQNAREAGRHDEGDFAAGLEIADKAAQEEEHDVNPQNQRWKWHIHSANPRSICAHIQAQNFARFAFGGDLERAAADFAIRGEGLRGDAGIDDDFKTLSAKGALDGFGDLHGS